MSLAANSDELPPSRDSAGPWPPGCQSRMVGYPWRDVVVRGPTADLPGGDKGKRRAEAEGQRGAPRKPPREQVLHRQVRADEERAQQQHLGSEPVVEHRMADQNSRGGQPY